MKQMLLCWLLLVAAACVAQPTEKKLYILRPYRLDASAKKMKLLVNGLVVRLPNKSIIEIPIANDSVQIEVLNKSFRKHSAPVRMGAMNENYFTASFAVTRGLFPKGFVALQQVPNDDCFKQCRKRARVVKPALL